MAWTKTRYQSVLKTFERIETTFKSQDASVYCYGTLQGVSLDGRPFENIRFSDRFAISNGKITQQEVWNDLAQAEVVKNEII
jgi:hypothetical protein